MAEKQKWLVYTEEETGYIHIVPDTDIAPHGYPNKENKAELEDFMCPCKPQVKNDDGIITIIHNSFEDAQRIEESIRNYGKKNV